MALFSKKIFGTDILLAKCNVNKERTKIVRCQVLKTDN